MLEMLMLLLVLAVFLRVGFGLAVIAFKLLFGFLALVFGGLLALGMLGLVIALGGTLAVGLAVLCVVALAPLWLPVMLAVVVIRLLWKSSSPLRTA